MKTMPKYAQVYSILRKRIEGGIYPIGSVLPPEPRLCEEFGKSRITIRKAMEILAHEHYIEVQQGRGTTVLSRSKITQELNYVTSLSETFRQQGYTVRVRDKHLDRIIVDDDIAGQMDFSEPTEVYCLKRTIEANGSPVALMSNYITPGFVPNLEQHFHLVDSLYQFLENYYGLIIEEAYNHIQARNPTPEEAEELELSSNTPVVVIKRQAFTQGKVFYYSNTIVDSSNYELSINQRGRKPT